MSHLSSGTSRSTLEALIDDFSQKDYQGFQLEVWVFADHQTRLAAEKKLRQLGVEARIFSAYKPLVHFFLESFSFEQYPSQSIEIGYPVSPHASQKRFLLEAYPLGAMLKDKPIRFFPDETCSDCYSVTFCNEPGENKAVTVFAPNHVSSSITGEESLSPTGWIKLYNPEGECLRDERLATDYEKVFQALMNVVQSYPWPEKPPYFERLCVRVAIPVKDEPVGYEHEVLSLKEALHEDLYFSIQEWFKFREGKCKTERNSQPGQIIPFICHSSHQGYDYDLDIEPYPLFTPESELQPLDKAFQPLSHRQVGIALDAIPGRLIEAETVTGNKVRAIYRQGNESAVMISGGQHANETTGVVGALRAALHLSARPQAHFVISPLENPDGYALHHELIRDNAKHMHHASRYTALGDDLEFRSKAPWYEKEIRRQAFQLSGAQLHINLHGYPSHEWTRPLSGYVPQGFEMWTIPKGFFLVLRYQNTSDWAEFAERFIQALTQKLNRYPEVITMNKKQIRLYEMHAGETGFRLINQFPCVISAVEQCDVPLQLITEYPDESIFDHDFIAGHNIQMATVLAAYDVFQSLKQLSLVEGAAEQRSIT